MRTFLVWPALALSVAPVWSAEPVARQAPAYTAASIVNAASSQPAALTPNALATIYGKELSFYTRALRSEDVVGGALPTILGSAGVQVLVNNQAASLYYVSPEQINILIPAGLRPGIARIVVVRQGLAGPEVEVRLQAAGPGIFQMGATTLLAAHPDGTTVTAENPARPGGVIVLYATGLGATVPPQLTGRIATAASSIENRPGLQIRLDGEAVPNDRILYAGITPGFGGLYQINLRLPDNVRANPELVVEIGGSASPSGLRLIVKVD